ncbi:hypothetical protein HNR42_003534 [Deinobacterium chartae]|uniref:DUF4388 domain-containing protein n=1 Tax=Deinobacterium chartae TaxID=521158 RepID=A0A841I781_9DEIO|nr:hypothetical protein [Deinobacterium chartae]MBB6100069.1 hypothetical protein [Deinobacterium chartae]
MSRAGRDTLPVLQRMFPEAKAPLVRLLPTGEVSFRGLGASFCDLHAFLRHLHDTSWYGHLHAHLEEQQVHVLVYEGRAVAAASEQHHGEMALGDLLNVFTAGASLDAYELRPEVAHALSGVSQRVWKVPPNEGFTGVLTGPAGSSLLRDGVPFARLEATFEEGVFPAPLRPQTLILPKPLAGWAHQNYALTLRGRDALNPITAVHQVFKTEVGAFALEFIKHLGSGRTPADYALRHDQPLHDLEPVLNALIKGGYLRAE